MRVKRGGPPTTKMTKYRANGAPTVARRTTRQQIAARQTRPDCLAEVPNPT